MRYLLLILVLAVALVVIIAGPRGGLTRRRPIEIFPDMNRQAKLLPQKPDGLFPDGRASQLPVPGTVARQSPYQNWPVYTGRVSGLTNFVATGSSAAGSGSKSPARPATGRRPTATASPASSA
jgi:hypothetical protein